MHWLIPKERVVRRFALWPTYIGNDTVVWLQFYWARQHRDFGHWTTFRKSLERPNT